MSVHSAPELIRTKRDGGELSDDAIRWFISGYASRQVPDEQASALLMAIFFNGMAPRELATWTQAMIDSGERLDLSGVGQPTVDKHSTGGVGDKISLILCPLVAACGVAVPQLSGRGLAHTGGTLDKLESIPGFRTNLSNDEFVDQLRECGAAITAAGPGLAPADGRLYALRDVTGTVDSIPLIASSIMSKKIAEGTDALVLDVKVGSGAFMKSRDQARALSETMVSLGADHGVMTRALITDMDTPLGLTAGNALEVRESVEVLAGGGPTDVVDLTLALASEMLDMAGVDADPAEALASGKAMDVWRRMVAAQGGDPDVPLVSAPHVEYVEAPADGIVASVDALAVGKAALHLGAGRLFRGQEVSAAAGVVMKAVPGERVSVGAVLAELHADDPAKISDGREAISEAFVLGSAAPTKDKVVLERVLGAER